MSIPTRQRRVRLWTDAEIGFLLDNDDSMTDAEIAEQLGRTPRSVMGKKHKLRTGHVSTKEPWTESDDDFLRHSPHLTARQAARYLGRAKTAVNKRRQYLAQQYGVVFHDGSNKDPHRPGDRRLLAKTCPDCGLLLDAGWFGLNHEGHSKGWRTQCIRCRPRYSNQEPWRGADTKANREKLQAITLPHAVNHKKPWVESDHAVLSDPDKTVIEKALTLGRTYFATHSACSDNGYRSLIGKGDPTKGQWQIHFPQTTNKAVTGAPA